MCAAAGYEVYVAAIADPQFDPEKVDAAALAKNLANLARYIGKRKSGMA
jgi:hypothetical protein